MNTLTLSQHELFLLDLIRSTIASNCPILATKTKIVLEVASSHGECDRRAIWQQLTPAEQSKFKELLTCTP